MIPVIAPVPGHELHGEIAGHEPLRTFRGLELYSLSGNDCPAVMREIGRLREVAFRTAGAGRNVECDVDALDFGPTAYRQLVAWDPQAREIVALYRYQRGALAAEHGDGVMRTHMLFRYSALFEAQIKPYCIELGRSVVNEDAQRRVLGLFALWTGLHALLAASPDLRYWFGNVSLYENMPGGARDLIVAFLERHYRPPEPVLIAYGDLRYRPTAEALNTVGRIAPEDDPAGRIGALRELLRPWGTTIPPILRSYMGLSTTIWFGETARDADFGDALETGIVVPVAALRRTNALARFEPRDPARYRVEQRFRAADGRMSKSAPP